MPLQRWGGSQDPYVGRHYRLGGTLNAGPVLRHLEDLEALGIDHVARAAGLIGPLTSP
jgi:hypothetical protein